MKVGQIDKNMIDYTVVLEKAIVIGIRSTRKETRSEAEDSWAELSSLVESAGAVVVEKVFCDLSQIRVGTYIGKGKVEEIGEMIREKEIDIAILDVPLSPPQQRNLETAWSIRVIDRTGVILDIFADRAATNEGQLQVELAQLEYRLPRLTRMWEHLGRLGAGIGTKGPGETQLEVDRRRIRSRLTKLRSDLKKIKKRRRLQRLGRQKSGIPTIAIVGYTNAGKSTLLNLLTGANATVKDQLFVTLDPTIRQLTLPNQQVVILSDTVGFISRLPHELVAAFHATLEEVIEADLLLHVVDASSPNREEQIKDVETVLKQLGADNKPVFMINNKIDLAPELAPGKSENETETYAISAVCNQGIDELLEGLVNYQSRHAIPAVFLIPYAESSVAAKIREYCDIREEKFEDRGVRLTVIAKSALINKFSQYLDTGEIT
ncbi:GTPase HflX [bacterium]|nr:GTPase HflX [bacterium]